MELTINEKVYQFKFGFGFLNDINDTVIAPEKDSFGRPVGVGFRAAIADLADHKLNGLITILDIGNKGMIPRLTRSEIIEYLEDEDTDLIALTNEVFSQLKKSKSCAMQEARTLTIASEFLTKKTATKKK